MTRILVTGGPVAANLDAVKLITNRFKGGRMLALANELANDGARVTYLASEIPGHMRVHENCEWVKHTGFDDYMEKVLAMAPDYDAVVLGAAVANLIPDERWKEIALQGGKFPSHNYLEGDPVQVLMRIAPRVINRVHAAAPRTKIIGFKLLSGVSRKGLVEAAKITLQESRAKVVIANDARNLDKKVIVTPEGDHDLQGELSHLVMEIASDEYYSTVSDSGIDTSDEALAAMESYDDLAKKDLKIRSHGSAWNGMMFGCIATRIEGSGDPSFVISSRGKEHLSERCVVRFVDHGARRVCVEGPKKASLNAPLIDTIFREFPSARTVIHYHEVTIDRWALPYAPPGTVRDSVRDLPDLNTKRSFEIRGHGTFVIMED